MPLSKAKLPIRLAFASVNHKAPSGPTTIADRYKPVGASAVTKPPGNGNVDVGVLDNVVNVVMVVTGGEDVVMGVVVEVFIEVKVLIPVIAAGVDIANVSCVEESVFLHPANPTKTKMKSIKIPNNRCLVKILI